MVKRISHIIGLLCVAILLVDCAGFDEWAGLDVFDDNTTPLANQDHFATRRYTEVGFSTSPLVEFIVDEKDKICVDYSNHVQKTCDYAKIPYNEIAIVNWNRGNAIAKSTRVLCLYNSSELSDATFQQLFDFVSKGGTLFLPTVPQDNRLAYLMGFKPSATFAYDTNSKGFHFTTPFIPSLQGKKYLKDFKLYGYAASNFNASIQVLASASSNTSYPAIYKNKIGLGTVVVFNTSNTFLKVDRGLLFSGLLQGLEGVPYPIANTATIFLDDFPSPQYNSKEQPIAEELNLTMVDFVKKVWWPDMKKISRNYGIPYTAMTTFDYRNKIVPPFTFDQWNEEKILAKNARVQFCDWLVADVARNKHEVAFHGYNHVSLVKDYWGNLDYMGISLKTALKKWEISNYGALPTVYVPPSNEIDNYGLLTLKQNMPSLNYMCSLYFGEFEKGGNREFDFDPIEKSLFDFPRISSGFYVNDDRNYYIQSLFLYTGIWNHFVHPDDVYQIPITRVTQEEKDDMRNGEELGWYSTKGSKRSMYGEFTGLINHMKSSYPALRFLKANDAANQVVDWRAARYTHESKRGVYQVEHTSQTANGKQSWFVFVEQANVSRLEFDLVGQKLKFYKTPYSNGVLFTITTPNASIAIPDIRAKELGSIEYQNAIVEQEKAKQQEFITQAQAFIAGTLPDEAQLALINTLKRLRLELPTIPEIDSTNWNLFAKHESWEGRAEQVWKMYENHVTKYPSKNNILYSAELDRVIGYLNDIEKEKWMSRQIEVDPENLTLLHDYVLNYDTEEYRAKIKKALTQIDQLERSPESKMNLLLHLLQFNPEEVPPLADAISPAADYSKIATSLVWFYADKKDYQKAYDWSMYASDIDFITKMNWLVELKKYEELEKQYTQHIASKPNDDQAKAIMSAVFHELGRFRDSWVVANSMQDPTRQEPIRKTLNTDVVYEADPLIEDLMTNERALFYPEVLAFITKKQRLEKGDVIDALSSVETNREYVSVQKNLLTYTHKDKKNNFHSFSSAYTQFFTLPTNKVYGDNYYVSLMGLQYRFATAIKDLKPQYWYKGRVEVDRKANPYVHAGLGYSMGKTNSFQSAELNLLPVETAAGVRKKMYEIRFNFYQDFKFIKYVNSSIAFETNYFTQGMLGIDTVFAPLPRVQQPLGRKVFTAIDANSYSVTTYDYAIRSSLTYRMVYDKGLIRRSKFLPFTEGSYSMASIELLDGYPYFMLRNRFYAGAGVGWQYQLTNFNSRVEAGYFYDTYSDFFQRYVANASYQIADYTSINLAIEYYLQSRFYFNTVQIGLTHNLKKRTRKK
ncbi:MAG: hypothetical protein RLZ77_1912 [Bacteroidota bacterium]